MNVSSMLASTTQTAPYALRGTPTTAQPGQREAVRKQAVEFESVYLSQMLQPMFAEIKGAASFEDGVGQDVWRGMQVDEFAKAIAKQGGIGIADKVAEELLRAQEAVQEKRS